MVMAKKGCCYFVVIVHGTSDHVLVLREEVACREVCMIGWACGRVRRGQRRRV